MVNLQPSPEEWREIEEYPGYQISSTGRAKNTETNRIIRGNGGSLRFDKFEDRPSVSIRTLYFKYFPLRYWKSYKTIEGEEWRDVAGYEGLYEASNKGRIRSVAFVTVRTNGRIYSASPTILKNRVRGSKAKKYHAVRLYRGGASIIYSVQRLIAIAFHENPQNKPIVHHVDNEPFNNNADNLRWATHSENVFECVEMGNSAFKRKRVMIMDPAGNDLMIVSGIQKAGRVVNPSSLASARRCISNCCSGKIRSYLGLRFRLHP